MTNGKFPTNAYYRSFYIVQIKRVKMNFRRKELSDENYMEINYMKKLHVLKLHGNKLHALKFHDENYT